MPSHARPLPIPAILILIALALGTTAQPAFAGPAESEPDVRTLLAGISAIAAPGSPGPLLVFGERAFPVVTPHGQTLIAAARWGEGRVVAFGHDGYLDAAAHDTPAFRAHAIRWAAGGVDNPRVLTPEGKPWRDALADADVLVITSHALTDPADRAAIAEFVKAGGGLVTAGLGWGWLQLNPGKAIADHPGSLLLRDAGIAWADGTIDEDPGDLYRTADPPSPMAHADWALDVIAGEFPGDQAAAAATLTSALRTLPGKGFISPEQPTPLQARLERLLGRKQAEFENLYREMHVTGLTYEDHALARLGIELFMADVFDAPPRWITRHPAAEGFPGATPPYREPRPVMGISLAAVDINTSIPGWRCTGRYAPAGAVIEVLLADPALAKAGLTLQIGAHLDPEDRGPLNRLPRMVRRFPVDAPRMEIASPVGGMIYLDVPAGFQSASVAVTLHNSVPAPHFILGHTTDDAWQSGIRDLPAPWAEFETANIAFTVPSEFIRDLDNPADLMTFWDRVATTHAQLEPRRLNGLGDRQARYVPDISVSYGYMYAPADRPLTVPLTTSAVMVDLDTLRTNGHGDVWGLFHELGHWHQNSMWTFEGTGEVTVNIFTLYTLDTLCGIPPAQARGFTDASMLATMKAHAAAGSPFDAWTQDPFLALTMYAQLQRTFGWDLFKSVFAEYRALPEDQRPGSDDAKRDQWMTRLSRSSGKNLAGFFKAWGVPVSDQAVASIADLPAWMPEGW